MTITPKHTPLPWVLEEAGFKSEGRFYVASASGDICDLYFMTDAKKFHSHKNGEANAAFIVAACNGHYELKKQNAMLLEALKALTNFVEGKLMPKRKADSLGVLIGKAPTLKARAAIASAESSHV